MLDTTQQCNECSNYKPLNAFHYHSRDKKYSAKCKDCTNNIKRQKWAANPELYRKRNRDQYKKDPSRFKDYDLQRTYGINLAQYNAMFVLQNGCCAICKRHQSQFKRALAVDHCHDSGDIRGLLCGDCNLGLGKFSDKPELLIAAADYLNNKGSL